MPHKEMSHWRGIGRFPEEKWKKISEFYFSLYKKLLSNSKQKYKKISILEWGGGGGANAWKFGMELDCDYYDVDISMPNLLEAEKQFATVRLNGTFAKVYLDDITDFLPFLIA